MATYYDYLRDRVLVSSGGNQAQLEHLIHSERNALWQQIVTNPAYDEQGRLRALAAFDEAASRILSEQGARFGRQPHDMAAQRAGGRTPGPQSAPHDEAGWRTRPLLRDLLLLLIGAALGFAAGYLAKGNLPGLLSGTAADNTLGVLSLTPSTPRFKFVRSGPSPLEGELKVDYARGTEARGYDCTVEATYRQVLEYVRFEDTCQRVAFKFLPLAELWENFNYVEGYMVFSAVISSSAGKRWEGSASVYFSINGETS